MFNQNVWSPTSLLRLALYLNEGWSLQLLAAKNVFRARKLEELQAAEPYSRRLVAQIQRENPDRAKALLKAFFDGWPREFSLSALKRLTQWGDTITELTCKASGVRLDSIRSIKLLGPPSLDDLSDLERRRARLPRRPEPRSSSGSLPCPSFISAAKLVPEEDVMAFHLQLLAFAWGLDAQMIRDRGLSDSPVVSIKRLLGRRLPILSRRGHRNGKRIHERLRTLLGAYALRYPGFVSTTAISEFSGVAFATVISVFGAVGVNPDSWRAASVKLRRETPPSIAQLPLDPVEVFRLRLLRRVYRLSERDYDEQRIVTGQTRRLLPQVLRQEIPYLLRSEREKEKNMGVTLQGEQMLWHYTQLYAGECEPFEIAPLLDAELSFVWRLLGEMGYSRERWESCRRELIKKTEISIMGSRMEPEDLFHLHLASKSLKLSEAAICERLFPELGRDEVAQHLAIALPFSRRLTPGVNFAPKLTVFEEKMLELYLRKYQGKAPVKAIARFFALSPETVERKIRELKLSTNWKDAWKLEEQRLRAPMPVVITLSQWTTPQLLHAHIVEREFDLSIPQLEELQVIPGADAGDIQRHLAIDLTQYGVGLSKPKSRLNQQRRVMLEEYLRAFPGVVGLQAVERYWQIGHVELLRALAAVEMREEEWDLRWSAARQELWGKVLQRYELHGQSASSICHLQILAREYGYDAARLVQEGRVSGLTVEQVQACLRRKLPVPDATVRSGPVRELRSLSLLEYVLLDQFLRSNLGAISFDAISNFWHISRQVSVPLALQNAGISVSEWTEARRNAPNPVQPIPSIKVPGSTWQPVELFHLQLVAAERGLSAAEISAAGLFPGRAVKEIERHLAIEPPFERRKVMRKKKNAPPSGRLSIPEALALRDYLRAYPGDVDVNVIARYWNVHHDTVVDNIRACGLSWELWKRSPIERARRISVKIPGASWKAVEVVYAQLVSESFGFGGDAPRYIGQLLGTTEEEAKSHLELVLPIVGRDQALRRTGGRMNLPERRLLDDLLKSYPGVTSNVAIGKFFGINALTVADAVEEAGHSADAWANAQAKHEQKLLARLSVTLAGATLSTSQVLHALYLASEGYACEQMVNDPVLLNATSEEIARHLQLETPFPRLTADIIGRTPLTLLERCALYAYLRECTGRAPIACLARFWKLKNDTLRFCLQAAGVSIEEWNKVRFPQKEAA